jgi:hypothetical protein
MAYRLHLIGATEFPLSGVHYTAQPWRAETEVADLERMDIGLVLPDNEWNRRKFPMKVAQYMALGRPRCEPPRENPDVIPHGVDGFRHLQPRSGRSRSKATDG